MDVRSAVGTRQKAIGNLLGTEICAVLSSTNIHDRTAMAQPQPPLREDVIAACERNGPHSNGLVYSDLIFIKYGWDVTLAEAKLQQFVYENADLILFTLQGCTTHLLYHVAVHQT